MRLAICSRTDRPAAIEAAASAAKRLRVRGVDVAEVDLDAAGLARDVAGAAMVCVFGGDGTMLRAARRIAPLGIPLLGVNLGRLGFLTGTSVDELDRTMDEVLAGSYECEDRTLLEATVTREMLARRRSLLYLERLRLFHAVVTIVLTIALLAWAIALWQRGAATTEGTIHAPWE